MDGKRWTRTTGISPDHPLVPLRGTSATEEIQHRGDFITPIIIFMPPAILPVRCGEVMNRLSPELIQSYAGQRRKMVEEQLVERGVKDLRVLEAMSRVPRHLFAQESLQHRAYGDAALPIGENQTLSQPYIVGAMTAALGLKGEERVLEIGTGSGYQTAIVAELARQVFTIERLNNLSRKAQQILEGLNYMNIVFKMFDGTYGWPDQAPFDAILITASAKEIPESLIKQLGEGGRLVAPTGDTDNQKLVVLTKNGSRVNRRELGDCKFVPLIGKYGWPAVT